MLLDEADFVRRVNIVQGDLSAIVENSNIERISASRTLHIFILAYVNVSSDKEKDVNFICYKFIEQNFESSPLLLAKESALNVKS